MEELINSFENEIIRNIFKKLNEEEIYVILELNNQLQDKINKIDKAIEYIKENACYDKDVKKCCDDLNYNECDKLLEILGDKENE